MDDYLVMRLYGPLASWGEIAVGEVRHTALHPSRSALLGLLGAALGVDREDDAGQVALSTGYRFAVKLLAEGSPMNDYHTVQSPAQRRNVLFRTRRAEILAESKPGALLSSREYRCDSIAIVAVQATESAPVSLARLAAALQAPTFPLYLGRKACTLALPVYPQIVRCETARQALDETPQPAMMELAFSRGKSARAGEWDRKVFGKSGPTYYWEAGMSNGEYSFQTERHDQPLSRRRWQFQPRVEYVFWEDKRT